MKKSVFIILLLISSITMIGCGTKTLEEEFPSETIDTNTIEKNIENISKQDTSNTVNYLDGINKAPEYDLEDNKEDKPQIAKDFEDTYSSNIINEENQTTINSQSINSSNSKSSNTQKNNDVIDDNKTNNSDIEKKNNNSNTQKDIKQNDTTTNDTTNSIKQKTLSVVSNFINPKDYSFENLNNSQEFKEFKNYVSSQSNGTCEISIDNNCLSYSSSNNGPNIELYRNDDYYAIFLYCVLNEDSSSNKYSNDEIKLNKEVLQSLLNTISSTPKELFDKIYDDYEVNSTLSEKTYTNVGDAKIKTEIMQKYVIYYIAK